jgi:hypothetical protein
MMTIAHVLPLVVAAEKVVACMYLGLAGRFPDYEKLAGLWQKFGREETIHIAWLEDFHSRLPAYVLDQAVDPVIVRSLEQVAAFPIEQAVQKVSNLKEAVELIEQVDRSDAHGFYAYLIFLFSNPANYQAGEKSAGGSGPRRQWSGLSTSGGNPVHG